MSAKPLATCVVCYLRYTYIYTWMDGSWWFLAVCLLFQLSTVMKEKTCACLSLGAELGVETVSSLFLSFSVLVSGIFPGLTKAEAWEGILET